MNWILVVLFLNAQTGDLVRFTERPSTIEECAQPAAPVQVLDGLAQVTICKQTDSHGKVLPALPDGPKVES